MTTTCPITGTAEVTVDLVLNRMWWDRADDEVCVHGRVVRTDRSLRRLATMYEPVERCPHSPHRWHARRKESGALFPYGYNLDVLRGMSLS